MHKVELDIKEDLDNVWKWVGVDK